LAASQRRWAVELPALLGPASTLPEPNVALVNAPALWGMGYTGQGVVVASLDTGVDVSHPDLAASYRGGANSWYDPYNENAAPADFYGNHHGTMTMSLIVGGSAGGSNIGIAPGAKWISAKIFNNAGGATETAIHQALQWVLNPNNDPTNPGAPDVVNNSWGYQYPGCNLNFQWDVQALAAAGIVPIFAAGNSGPNSSSDTSPANNAGAFAVGAIDNNSLINSQSSRGPNSCNTAAPFPNLVAPGVALRAAVPEGLYSTCTGTSCAAPEVTGGIALLLSALPHLGLNLREQSLMQGAFDLGPAGYDPSYGYGRLDVLSAYHWLTTTLLQAPTGLSAAAVSASQIDLHWINNTLLATQITIQRSPDGVSGWSTINTSAANLNTYSDTTGLVEGTPYFYRVQAANVNAASVMVGGCSATTWLAAPTLSAAAVSSTQINLRWVNNSAHATGFEVQRSPDGLNGWTTLAATAAGVTSYLDTPPISGVFDHYRVRALGAGVNSAYSAPTAIFAVPFWVYFPVMTH